MLDTITKRRIDDCRDILVGKLPDPKAQIEQITIGLIYKFMDDMDKEAVELGGETKFFSDYKVPDPEFPNDRSKDKLIEFSKYAWGNLMNPKVSAAEMLTLYSEAIEGMEKNPNIPQLFRDIFSNAYLPYRDPETLKLFLKTIGEFEYTHSEKLGDAFEYLLSVMGSQGDAGQFRTPRHIIDFLVAIIDPDKSDTIMDPACGTAGFLIAAYKHILLKYSKGNTKGLNVYQYNLLKDEDKFPLNFDQLTPDDRKKLIQNFVGYDISPDMVRLSLVNLYLHGFNTPNIHEYDTLSSEERWNENFDVILANPPFMSPKGGIRPHKKFTISSNRSEVLFVDYIAEHLNPKGKAGIIVPEGIIFQSGTAYKDLRKMLVENYLYAVVSLPAGVFNPYSGVKTSILLMDKEIAKQRDEILFIKIDNDGYNLGAQRSAVKGGQLQEAIKLTHNFIATEDLEETPIAHIVPKAEIAKNGDYNLSGERYKIDVINVSKFPIVSVEEVAKINPLKSEIKNLSPELEVSFVPMADLNENQISFEPSQSKQIKEVFNGYTYFENEDVLIAKVTPCFENGKAGVARNLKNGIGFGSSEFYVLRTEGRIKSDFLYRLLTTNKFQQYAIPKMTGTGGLRRVPKNVFAEFKIPLPPLSVQEEIVAEIEGYQKIIDGAKAVVTNYKPKIDIDPDWEMVELDSIADIISGNAFSSSDFNEDNPIRCIKITNVGVREFVNDDTGRLPESYLTQYSRFAVNTGDLVISLTRTIISSGLKVAIVPDSWKNTLVNQRVACIKPTNKSNILFIYYYLCSDAVYRYVEEKSRSLMQPNLSITDLKNLEIPCPPIESQNEIVAQIEKEQELVNANKQLIEIFEQKIKDRIAKVWGE